MKVELFVIDPATRMVDLNKPWIGTIKEFKKILVRDRGSKNDADGRKKEQATREFTFIFHYCDYASKFSNFSEEDRYKACQMNAELPDNFDFKKDEDLVAAIMKYREMQETPALKILKEAEEGLHSAHRVVAKIRLALESELARIDLTKPLEEDDEDFDPKNKKKKADPISKITTLLINLMNVTNQIQPAMENIDALEEMVKKQLGNKQELRGGKTKGEREDAPITASRERVSNLSESKQGVFSDI